MTYWLSARQLGGTLLADFEGDKGLVKLHADYHVGYYLGYAAAWARACEGVTVGQETRGYTAVTR